MKFKQKPYHLLLYTALLLILNSFLVINQNNSVDFHLHDTYFVISNTHIFWLLAILALVIWILYLFTYKILFSKVLIWGHVIISILTILLFLSSLYFRNNILNPIPRKYYDLNDWNTLGIDSIATKFFSIIILILVFGQLLFIINFVIGLVKPKKL